MNMVVVFRFLTGTFFLVCIYSAICFVEAIHDGEAARVWSAWALAMLIFWFITARLWERLMELETAVKPSEQPRYVAAEDEDDEPARQSADTRPLNRYVDDED